MSPIENGFQSVYPVGEINIIFYCDRTQIKSILCNKKGKTKFGFSSQLGISSAINQIEYLNGAQYNELRNEYLSNTGVTIVPYNGVNTDWFDLLNGTGIFNKYNFNF